MSASRQHFEPVQRGAVGAAGVIAAIAFAYLYSLGAWRLPWLLLIGCGLGVVLYHATFGFTGAYRRAFEQRQFDGVRAQILMLALATILFAPVLAAGSAFGNPVTGAYAPLSLSVVFGAFVFGIGMQLGGGCASGTLFTAGGGNVRMVIVGVFFCVGCFIASLHLPWWQRAPSAGVIALGPQWSWPGAVLAQLGLLLLIYLGLRRYAVAVTVAVTPASHGRATPSYPSLRWLRGPWPLYVGAVGLAGLNWLTLVVAGHPWSITWGFTLWGAKGAMLLGWDPQSSAFWSGPFQSQALASTVFTDQTSVMNMGIVLGAFAAAALAGRVAPRFAVPPAAMMSAVVGGLLLGYGARLAYGCNIGAFFSGVASTSLHGWVWLVAALAGNAVVLRYRHRFAAFGTANPQGGNKT